MMVDGEQGSEKQTKKIFLKIKQQISNKTSPILEKFLEKRLVEILRCFL